MGDVLMYEIIGIDLGSYSLKTSTGFKCRSVYKEKDSLTVDAKDVLEYNGTEYQIGIGDFDTEIIKAQKRDTLPLFLYGLSQSVSLNTTTVKVVTGLPKYQMDNKESVDAIKDKFKGRFVFTVDKIVYDIDVLDVAIFPEGVGAYYSTPDLDQEKDYILIDIGGSTFNVALFQNGEFIKVKTLPFGSMNLLEDIRSHAMTLHSSKYTLDDMERYRKRGVIGKTNDNMEYTYRFAEEYVKKLFNLLKLDFPYKDCDLILCGGGVEMFAQNIIDRVSDAALIEDYLFANAKGFGIVGGELFG